jgi:hypothetical protein
MNASIVARFNLIVLLILVVERCTGNSTTAFDMAAFIGYTPSEFRKQVQHCRCASAAELPPFRPGTHS